MIAPLPANLWNQMSVRPTSIGGPPRTGWQLWAWFAEENQSIWDRLDPVRRTMALMTLLGLILVGFLLVMLVLAGGRFVRRLARDRRTAALPRDDQWYRKPLIESADPDADTKPSES